MYANDKALDKNWHTADRAAMVDFGDCARTDLFWLDGGYAYEIFDTTEQAFNNLKRLGFSPSSQGNEL